MEILRWPLSEREKKRETWTGQVNPIYATIMEKTRKDITIIPWKPRALEAQKLLGISPKSTRESRLQHIIGSPLNIELVDQQLVSDHTVHGHEIYSRPQVLGYFPGKNCLMQVLALAYGV